MGQWEGGLNRRKFPRVSYPCLLILRNNNENENEALLTHTENIGVGGVCVILRRPLKMFCPVEVELDLLDLKEHIKCKAKVVWNVQRKGELSRKPLFFDTGIEFVDLMQKDYQRLQEIIARLVRNQKTEIEVGAVSNK